MAGEGNEEEERDPKTKFVQGLPSTGCNSPIRQFVLFQVI